MYPHSNAEWYEIVKNFDYNSLLTNALGSDTIMTISIVLILIVVVAVVVYNTL